MLKYKNIGLSASEESTIDQLLNSCPVNPPGQREIWGLMDSVWKTCNCDNLHPKKDCLSRFYSHPVWILNGLFIEQDKESMRHRHAISNWIVAKFKGPRSFRVIDYGGGYGSIGKLIEQKSSNIHVEIFEPYLNSARAINSGSKPPTGNQWKEYDCLTSIDVLEHVIDPLATLSEMVSAVRKGGYLLIANNFYPVIKCHLPANFHFRYSFVLLALLWGLNYLGPCRGSHALIFKKMAQKGGKHEVFAKKMARLSKSMFPYLNLLHDIYRKFK